MPNLKAAAAAFRAGGHGIILAAQVGVLSSEANHDRDARQTLEKIVLEQGVDGPCAILEACGGFTLPEGSEARKAVVVYGDEDTFAKPEDAEEPASQLGGQAVRISACGHAMLLEKPEKTLDIVRAAIGV